MNIGLKISVLYYEEAKDYYKRIFTSIDTDGSGEIDFSEFQQMIKKL
jgi:Ca2+-binding EF-hand superfamily protein